MFWKIRNKMKRKLSNKNKTFNKNSEPIPKMTEVMAFPPMPSERFALKITFDNCECKKYIFYIDKKDADKETVLINGVEMSDKIWASATIVSNFKGKEKGYDEWQDYIIFENNSYVTGKECYLKSIPYSEPTIINEVVYFNDKIQVKRSWSWDRKIVYNHYNEPLLAYDENRNQTFVSQDGKRLSTLDFNITSDAGDGISVAGKSGYGCGLIDKDMHFITPMKYDDVDDFAEGKAIARLGEEWFIIDKYGNESELGGAGNSERYKKVKGFSDGMCMVSTSDIDWMQLASHSDYEPGVWGFVNEKGEEVISPQYIFANDFQGGIAIVAKGEWSIYPKWDDEHDQCRYWSEEELWGGIDKRGNEVIPFIFDEIVAYMVYEKEDISKRGEIYKAHVGGWENGYWGIIDRKGKWIVQPQFEDIGFEYHDGLFTFYRENMWGGEPKMGIYDIKQNKVLFEPQFDDVEFCDNGDIIVEVFDKNLNRSVKKIMDRTCKERFNSNYTDITYRYGFYEVSIIDKDKCSYGVVDKNGKMLCPMVASAERELPFERCTSDGRIVFYKNGKKGMKSFNGNVLIEPKYGDISGLDNPFLTVTVSDGKYAYDGLITHDGETVIPPKYSYIMWHKNKNCFTCQTEDSIELYIIEDKEKV